MKYTKVIKVVLPSILNSSRFIQNKYKQLIGNTKISSLNFNEDQVWLKFENNEVKSPYKLLPPLFSEWTYEGGYGRRSELFH